MFDCSSNWESGWFLREKQLQNSRVTQTKCWSLDVIFTWFSQLKKNILSLSWVLAFNVCTLSLCVLLFQQICWSITHIIFCTHKTFKVSLALRWWMWLTAPGRCRKVHWPNISRRHLSPTIRQEDILTYTLLNHAGVCPRHVKLEWSDSYVTWWYIFHDFYTKPDDSRKGMN